MPAAAFCRCRTAPCGRSSAFSAVLPDEFRPVGRPFSGPACFFSEKDFVFSPGSAARSYNSALGREMYLLGPESHPGQRRPVVLLLAVQAFQVNVARGAFPLAREAAVPVNGPGPARGPASSSSSRMVGMMSMRRTRSADRRGRPRQFRVRKNQRHPDVFLIAEYAVPVLLMLAERLAVVAGDNDQRVVRQPLVPAGPAASGR